MISQSHGKPPRNTISWVIAPAALVAARNAALPPSSLVRTKSLVAATLGPTSNGAAATSKPNTAPTDS